MQESAGIFQFGTAQLVPSVEALTLAGAIASATGAPLGDPEFDVHTWLREQFVALACPEDNAVPFTGHALQSALYGYKSGQTRKLLIRALDNLTRAFVTIPGFDARRGVLDPDAVSRRLRLLEGVVEHGFYERFAAARARGEPPSEPSWGCWRLLALETRRKLCQRIMELEGRRAGAIRVKRRPRR